MVDVTIFMNWKHSMCKLFLAIFNKSLSNLPKCTRINIWSNVFLMISLAYLFSLALCKMFLKQVVEPNIFYQILVTTTLIKADPADFDIMYKFMKYLFRYYAVFIKNITLSGNKSSHLLMFYKKDFLKNFAKFTVERLH